MNKKTDTVKKTGEQKNRKSNQKVHEPAYLTHSYIKLTEFTVFFFMPLPVVLANVLPVSSGKQENSRRKRLSVMDTG